MNPSFARNAPTLIALAAIAACLAACGGGNGDEPAQADEGDSRAVALAAAERVPLDLRQGRRLFERETFGGNGRTCRTCHSGDTGTVSPEDAQHRFAADSSDPLFQGDGSDDGQGHGATRMQRDATVLVRVALPPNVSLADDPTARSVVLRRGIPSTLNTPALDPVLMLDGRQPDLMAQAAGAIADHAQATRQPSRHELVQIAAFQQLPEFFSSPAMLRYAFLGQQPRLPEGRSESEKRGRRFFVDAPPEGDFKTGLCAGCHSGPMLNETNEFVPAPPFKRGGRFQTVGVSEFNAAGNPVHDYVFKQPDGGTVTVRSPDPGRALITGDVSDNQNLNAFKTPSLWGVARTAPYFHDNSARTLEEVAAHYAKFFAAVSPLVLTAQDQADIVAYMRLLK